MYSATARKFPDDASFGLRFAQLFAPTWSRFATVVAASLTRRSGERETRRREVAKVEENMSWRCESRASKPPRSNQLRHKFRKLHPRATDCSRSPLSGRARDHSRLLVWIGDVYGSGADGGERASGRRQVVEDDAWLHLDRRTDNRPGN